MIRLFIANFAGACVVAWAWWLGQLDRFYDHGAVWLLAGVFAAGVVSAFLSLARKTAALLKAEHLEDFVKALFVIGIIGNAWGMLQAFAGIDPGALSEPARAAEAGANLLAGAGTAFGSTLVGLTLALWMMINVRIVNTALSLRGA